MSTHPTTATAAAVAASPTFPYSPFPTLLHPSLFSYATRCRQFGLTCRSGHRVRHNRSAASICTGCHRRAHRCRQRTGSHGSPAAPDTVACCRCDSERSRRDNCRECCSVAFAAWCRRRRCANMLTTPTRRTTDRRCRLILSRCCHHSWLVSVAAIDV